MSTAMRSPGNKPTVSSQGLGAIQHSAISVDIHQEPDSAPESVEKSVTESLRKTIPGSAGKSTGKSVDNSVVNPVSKSPVKRSKRMAHLNDVIQDDPDDPNIPDNLEDPDWQPSSVRKGRKTRN